MTKPLLLNLVHESPRALLPSEGICDIVHAHEHGGREAAIAAFAPHIQAVVTHGVHGLSAAEMELMPRLSILACIGAGFDNVDLAAARARGIALSYGPDTNAATTADHAVALLLGIVRNLGALDRRMRLGGWKHPSDEPPALSGKRLGLAGVGRIGQGIGQRCEAGFGMEVAYFSRRRRPELAWTHMGELAALALPGDADTHHIVNSAVLKALGPAGYLVNIGRGALVDTQALTVALREHQIAGAALDVFEDEPRVSAQLLLLDNVLLSPHLAGRSPEAQAAMARLLAQNLAAHFGGRPLSTPIPA
jgi:lactate dehydrogenase-like 2-hydroxyacid dehydrogenase